MNFKAISQFILLSTTLAIVVAHANPEGGQIVNGDIVIHPTDTSGTMIIDQFTDKGVINWNSFNIGGNEATIINQPNSSSTHLSRVIGEDPSQILGKLSSNGKVFLVNPNGIIFGEGAKLDAPALVASTLSIKDQDFKNAHYDFNAALNRDGKAGAIINEGMLTAPSGLIALLAPQIKNKGIINAELGQVELGAGTQATLKMGNNPLVDFEIDQPMVVVNEDGAPVVIDNSGTIKANGGQVYLSAAGAHQVLHQVVSNSGVIEANSVAEKNGQIILYAQNADAEVSGSLKAEGGKIGVYGKHININDGAKINVSGAQAGTINIGGPAGGKGNLPKADETIIAQGASLKADSTGTNKEGGQIVVWANEYTKALGDFSAQSVSGHGGLVETSSAHNFDVMGARVNTSSQHAGWSGTWLLDPSDVTIDATLAAQIVAALATTNVLVTTAAGTGSGVGDLTVASNITYSGGSENNNLTLRAEHDINVNAVINGTTNGNIVLQAVNDINMNTGGAIASSGTGTISLRADYNGTGTGTVVFGGVGAQISKSGFGSLVEIFYNPTGGYTGAQESTVTSDYFSSRVVTAIGVSLDSYMLINSTSDLTTATTAVNAGDYAGYDPKFAFGKALNLTAYSFTPMGDANVSAQYAGHFNGLSYVISNLTYSDPAASGVGFFGTLSSSGTVRNLALTSINISANGATGSIAGASEGSIINSYATGVITAVADVGGLVGTMIQGAISNSYADVDITVGDYNMANSIRAGGLVGQMADGSNIFNSYASGNVTVGNNGGAPSTDVLAGGLVGYVYDSGSGLASTITSSYASGTVTGGTNSYLGGFVGLLASASAENAISNSYSTGAVNATSARFAGGFVGEMTTTDTAITNSYTVSLVGGAATKKGGFAGSIDVANNNSGLFWNTSIYGGSVPSAVGDGSSTGITNSTTAAMQTPSTFTGAGWSTSIWDLESGSYPTLVDVGLVPANANSTTTLPSSTPTPSTPAAGQTANSVNTSVVDTAVTENLETSVINTTNPAEPEAILTMDCDGDNCDSENGENKKVSKVNKA